MTFAHIATALFTLVLLLGALAGLIRQLRDGAPKIIKALRMDDTHI